MGPSLTYLQLGVETLQLELLDRTESSPGATSHTGGRILCENMLSSSRGYSGGTWIAFGMGLEHHDAKGGRGSKAGPQRPTSYVTLKQRVYIDFERAMFPC